MMNETLLRLAPRVADAQAIRAAAFDALGSRVAVVFGGTDRAGPTALDLDAGPPGQPEPPRRHR